MRLMTPAARRSGGGSRRTDEALELVRPSSPVVVRRSSLEMLRLLTGVESARRDAVSLLAVVDTWLVERSADGRGVTAVDELELELFEGVVAAAGECGSIDCAFVSRLLSTLARNGVGTMTVAVGAPLTVL